MAVNKRYARPRCRLDQQKEKATGEKPWLFEGRLIRVRPALRSASAREVAIDAVDQGADVLTHHLVGYEHDHRDRRENERVFGHRLPLRQSPCAVHAPSHTSWLKVPFLLPLFFVAIPSKPFIETYAVAVAL